MHRFVVLRNRTRSTETMRRFTVLAMQ